MLKKLKAVLALTLVFTLLPALGINAEASGSTRAATSVTDEASLLAALNAGDSEIVLANDIATTSKINITSPVSIDGAGHTITLNSPAGWQGDYVLHFYATTGKVSNITLTGGDAGLLVNGSTVELEGIINVSGNEFGGIEVSEGTGVTTPASIDLGNATLVNRQESDKNPTIWVAGPNVPTAPISNAGDYVVQVSENGKNYYGTKPLATGVTTQQELEDALSAGKTEIKLAGNITTTSKINIMSPVSIDGAGFSITGTVVPGDAWSGYYVLHFYNTTGSLTDIKLTGGNAGLLVNGSDVTLNGNIDVSGNNFGGIEVSKGAGVVTEPVLKVPATTTLVNSNDSKATPTIWLDGGVDATAVQVDGLKQVEIGGKIYFVINDIITTVTTEQELLDALADGDPNIVLGNNIALSSKVAIMKPVNIDGNGKTLSLTSPAGWQGDYVLQFYRTSGSLKNITLTGGDAGLLVNGSTVKLEGNIDVSGNEFGGIEISKGTGVTEEPTLDLGTATLTNSGDSKANPTVWVDGTIANPITGGSLIKTEIAGQIFYVIRPIVTTVNNEAELLQALADGDPTIVLGADIALTAPIEVNKPVTIDGANFKLTGVGTGTWNWNYVVIVQDTTATIKDIKLTNGDAGLLVNGSNVTLEGTIDVSGNTFGGIEVAKDYSVSNNSTLDITNATLVNTTEDYKLPTIWVNDNEGTVVGGNLHVDSNVKPGETHYYINETSKVEDDSKAIVASILDSLKSKEFEVVYDQNFNVTITKVGEVDALTADEITNLIVKAITSNGAVESYSLGGVLETDLDPVAVKETVTAYLTTLSKTRSLNLGNLLTKTIDLTLNVNSNGTIVPTDLKVQFADKTKGAPVKPKPPVDPVKPPVQPKDPSKEGKTPNTGIANIYPTYLALSAAGLALFVAIKARKRILSK